MRRVVGIFALGLLLAFAAPASGQAEPVALAATMDVTVDLDLRQLVWELPDDLELPVAPGVVLPAGDDCVAGRFNLGSDASWFRFREQTQENGCGEARMAAESVPGATRALLSFHADRSIQETNNVLESPVHIQQAIHLYDADWNLTASIPYYRDDEPSRPSGDDFDIVATNLVDGEPLHFGWFFRDGGFNPTQDTLTPLVGQEFSAAVRSAVLRHEGVPLPAQVLSERRVDWSDTDSTIEVAVGVEVPPLHGDAQGDLAPRPHGASRDVALQASTDWSLDRVLGPGGQVVPANLLRAEEADGVLTLHLSEPVLAAFGDGQYRAVFRAQESVAPSWWLTPVAIGAVVAPGITGTFAVRNAGRLRSAATDRFLKVIGHMRWLLAGLAVAYFVLLALLWTTPLWVAMRVWLPVAETVWLYAVLAVLTIGFVSIGSVWQRQILRTMETDLERERETQQRLRRSNEELERFAHLASHDLQEPLRTVSSYVQLLERRYGDRLDADAREYIEYATQGSQTMQQMIADLLAYSRLDATPVNWEAIDLAEWAAEARQAVQATTEERRGTINLDLGDVAITVHGDRVRLLRVLINLLGNALKFSAPAAPIITIAAGPDVNHPGFWRVSVHDNGPGIAAPYRAKAFGLFQRLQTRSQAPGTGLGLAVCKKIVEAHGGSMGIETSPLGGAEVWFTVPEASP